MQEQGGPRPYDAVTRGLIERDPESWLRWLGLPVDGPVRPIDSDLSTVLAVVDKVLRIDAPSPWLAHLELQASRDPDLPFRLLQYHALLLNNPRLNGQRLRVSTTVVLLRKGARLRGLNGHLVETDPADPTDEINVSFRYRVVRLWERPVSEILAAGLGVLPLAPLTDFAEDRLQEILDRLDERFAAEASPSEVDDLWASPLILMGVRYNRDTAGEIEQAGGELP